MKKIIIAVVSVIVAIILIFGIISGINHFKNRKSNEETSEQEAVEIKQSGLLWATTYDEVCKVAEENSLKILQSDENTENNEFFYVDEASVGGVPMQIYYRQNEEGAIQEFSCYIVPFQEDYADEETAVAKEHTGAELKAETDKIFKLLEDLFDIEIGNKYDIFTETDKLAKDDDGYKAILDNNATLTLSIRDWDKGFWNLSSMSADGVVYYELLHLYHPGNLPTEFDDYAVNFDLLTGTEVE